jgi:hypothetical protein
MKNIKDCEYSVFISFASEDDDAWWGWVDGLVDRLKTNLPARARIDGKLPPVFFSKTAPIASGHLNDELKDRIASSFAMILVAGHGYCESEHCMAELAYFRELAGEEGLRERLFIVTLTRSAEEKINARSEGMHDLVRIPFYDPADPEEPILPWGRGDRQLSLEFLNRMKPLITALGDKIVRSFREAPPLMSRHGTPIGPSVHFSWNESSIFAIGCVTRDLEEEAGAFAKRLTEQGARIVTLGPEALLKGRWNFGSATHLILPFNNSAPLIPYEPGGHLALQKKAWVASGGITETLIWLDMRHVQPDQPADERDAAFVADVSLHALRPGHVLVQDFNKAGHSGPLASSHMDVSIFIESNQNERHLWELLGKKIRRRWDALVEQKQSRGIIVDFYALPIDTFEPDMSLEAADGIVLFWGAKEANSLYPQIRRIDKRLPPIDRPPRFVAHLTPPRPHVDHPMPGHMWRVVRFAGPDIAGIDVVPEDNCDLDSFLLAVLDRCNRRDGDSAARPA